MPRPPVSEVDRAYGRRLGQHLREVRTSKGYSAQRVAELSELSIDTVRSIETGRIAAPSFKTVARISAALGLKLDDLRSAIETASGVEE